MTEDNEATRIVTMALSEGRGWFLFIGLVMGFLVSGMLHEFGFYIRKNDLAGCEILSIDARSYLRAIPQCADIFESILKRRSTP